MYAFLNKVVINRFVIILNSFEHPSDNLLIYFIYYCYLKYSFFPISLGLHLILRSNRKPANHPRPGVCLRVKGELAPDGRLAAVPGGACRCRQRLVEGLRQQHAPLSGAAGLYFASQTENHCRAVGPDVSQRNSRLPANTPGASAPPRLRFQVRAPHRRGWNCPLRSAAAAGGGTLRSLLAAVASRAVRRSVGWRGRLTSGQSLEVAVQSWSRFPSCARQRS